MRAMTKFTHFICKEIIGFLWASRTIWRCSILNGQRGRRPMENRTVTRPSFSLCCICCSGEARASTEGNYQTACKKNLLTIDICSQICLSAQKKADFVCWRKFKVCKMAEGETFRSEQLRDARSDSETDRYGRSGR